MRKHGVSFYQIFSHLWVKEKAEKINKKVLIKHFIGGRRILQFDKLYKLRAPVFYIFEFIPNEKIIWANQRQMT